MNSIIGLITFAYKNWKFYREAEVDTYLSTKISSIVNKVIKIRVMKDFNNACFSGIPPLGMIVISEELVKRMSDDQITAILLHEVGHKTVMQGIFSIFWRLTYYGGGLIATISKKDSKAAKKIIGLIIALINAYFIAWLSRRFEYSADKHAAKFGYGKQLSSALVGLEELYGLGVLDRYRDDLFASHPNTYKRVKRLGYNVDDFNKK
jgi:Zn-dependent protease with chaperone function